MDFAAETEAILPETGEEICFAFVDNAICTKTIDDQVVIPRMKDFSLLQKEILRKQYLGRADGCPCYALELAENVQVPGEMAVSNLRQLYGLVADEWFVLAGRAIQIMNWDRNHLYCGRCGGPVEKKPGEYAKVCPRCGLLFYPRISPAVIVAVVKDDKILLARDKVRKFAFYSVLAGFVEPGESLEDCIRREVWEEVRIKVKNIRYFGSQPWPFPDSLMIAFTAEYEEGALKADGKEILDAGWFSAHDLPLIPSKVSISRSLIDWFAASRQ